MHPWCLRGVVLQGTSWLFSWQLPSLCRRTSVAVANAACLSRAGSIKVCKWLHPEHVVGCKQTRQQHGGSLSRACVMSTQQQQTRSPCVQTAAAQVHQTLAELFELVWLGVQTRSDSRHYRGQVHKYSTKSSYVLEATAPSQLHLRTNTHLLTPIYCEESIIRGLHAVDAFPVLIVPRSARNKAPNSSAGSLTSSNITKRGAS
jgi:hypothetical protein